MLYTYKKPDRSIYMYQETTIARKSKDTLSFTEIINMLIVFYTIQDNNNTEIAGNILLRLSCDYYVNIEMILNDEMSNL